MKDQLSILKNRLDKELIVNDRIIRKAMRAKISIVKRQMIRLYIISIIAIPYCVWVFRNFIDISWTFTAVTIIFLIIACIYNYISHKDVKVNDLMTGNLIEVSCKITKMKRMSANWLKFSIPYMIIWLSWFILEVMHGKDAKEIIIGGLFGGFCGALFGVRLYRKNMKLINEVLQQIEELTEDNR